MSRTKKQHFIPRFYLSNFMDDVGLLWTHDSQRDTLRQTSPEKTGFETNIYTPVDDDGNRVELVETTLAEIESYAAPILNKLASCKAINAVEKSDFSTFLATMFSRSPAQLRQIAELMGATAHWMGSASIKSQNQENEKERKLTDSGRKLQEFIQNKENFTMSVDRRVGLMSFAHAEDMSNIMVNMRWSFEISTEQQLITSDNCVNWLNAGGPAPTKGLHGFGLEHPQAVIPFPLNPKIILRLDWEDRADWERCKLSKQRAKLANKYQAQYKERYLFFQERDEGFRKLGMKHRSVPQNIKTSIQTPNIEVVRKLSD